MVKLSTGFAPPSSVWATGFYQPVCHMPVYHPNIRISKCWGSAGEVTFYHRDGHCYWRTRDRHAFPGTVAQGAALNVHGRALECWRNVPDNIKEIWNEFASVVEPHKPPFDGSSHITGHNLFVSAYHGFAILRNEHIPEPMMSEPFPIFSMDYLDCSAAGYGLLKIRFRLTICGFGEPWRYRVLGKYQVGEPDCGRNPGLMRNCLSESVPAESVR